MTTITPKALLAHHNALIALVRYLLDDRTGGVFSATVEMLSKVIGAKGALAYRVENNELVLVSENGLPRKAKAWLARMPIDDRPWFIAQRVAGTQKAEVDSQLADSRMGHSIRPVLEAAGWRALAAAPIRVGRKVFGVLVVASASNDFDRQTLLLLETMCGVMALSSERDHSIQRGREDKQREAKTAQLATMGLLASNVARDLANPLASMQLQLEAQETRLQELREKLIAVLGDDEAKELDTLDEVEVLTGEIGAGLRHTQGITSRLLSFSRETRPESIDLTTVAHASIQLLREGIEARGILLQVEGDDQPLLVEGREEALQMLIVQLVLHAADEIDAAKVRGARILLQLLKEPGGCIISVASSGRGGPRSNVQLFDAMVRDQGTQAAAGLEIARQTAIAHGGQMEIGASELGGPLIRIVLPDPAARTPPPPEVAEEPPRRRLSAGSRPLIVWIDEDQSRVNSVSRMITTHETLIAGSIAEATELLDSIDQLPELIVCEVALSDGFGVDLHCEVDRELADRFVFVTGGVVGEDVAAYLKASGRPTLIKPVSVDEVRVLLKAEGASASPSGSGPPVVSVPAARSAPPAMTPVPLSPRGHGFRGDTPHPGPRGETPHSWRGGETPFPGEDPTHPGHRVDISAGVGASLFGAAGTAGAAPVHMRRSRRTQKRRDAATAQEVPRGPDDPTPDDRDDIGLPGVAEDDPLYAEVLADATPLRDDEMVIDDIQLDDEET